MKKNKHPSVTLLVKVAMMVTDLFAGVNVQVELMIVVLYVQMMLMLALMMLKIQ